MTYDPLYELPFDPNDYGAAEPIDLTDAPATDSGYLSSAASFIPMEDTGGSPDQITGPIYIACAAKSSVTAYWNGVLLGTMTSTLSCPSYDEIVFSAPNAEVLPVNVLAFRVALPASEAFFDASVYGGIFGSDGRYVGYGEEWRYSTVATAGGSGFEDPGFDDSTWNIGLAPWGQVGATCPIQANKATTVAGSQDLLVRKVVRFDQLVTQPSVTGELPPGYGLITGDELDPDAPPVPTGLTLSSDYTIGNDEMFAVVLDVTWDAVVADDLAGYDVQVTPAIQSVLVWAPEGSSYGVTVTQEVGGAVPVGSYAIIVTGAGSDSGETEGVKTTIDVTAGTQMVKIKVNAAIPGCSSYNVYFSADQVPKYAQSISAGVATSVSLGTGSPYAQTQSTAISWVAPQASSASANAVRFAPVPGGTFYAGRVRSVDRIGNASDWSAKATTTTAIDPEAPSIPNGLATIPGYRLVGLKWLGVTDVDLAEYQVRYAPVTIDGVPDGDGWTTLQSASTSIIITGLEAGTPSGSVDQVDPVQYVFQVRAADRSGQVATSAIDATAVSSEDMNAGWSNPASVVTAAALRPVVLYRLTDTTGTAARDAYPAGTAYQDVAVAGSPVSYWRFGEPSGTAAADVRGVNGGTYVGTPTLGVTGISGAGFNTAVTLNGTTQYVTVPDSTSLDLGDTFSISAWVKRSATGNVDYIVSKGTNGYALHINASNQVRLEKYGVTNGCYSTTTITDTTTWHHVVATRAPGVEHIYVDGEDVTTGTAVATAYANTATALLIGVGATTPTGPFHGSLDEVAIWGRVLTALEVATLYDAGTTAELDALYVGTPTLASAALLSGDALYKAVDLSGSGQRIDLPSALPVAMFEADNPWSWVAWVDIDTVPGTAAYLLESTFTSGTLQGVRISLATSLFKVERFLNGSAVDVATFDAPTTGIHHLAVVYTGTQLDVYWDGASYDDDSAHFIRDPSATTSLTAGARTTRLGGGSGGNYFNGRMQDVAIYDKALTHGEVSLIYYGSTVSPVRATPSQIGASDVAFNSLMAQIIDTNTLLADNIQGGNFVIKSRTAPEQSTYLTVYKGTTVIGRWDENGLIVRGGTTSAEKARAVRFLDGAVQFTDQFVTDDAMSGYPRSVAGGDPADEDTYWTTSIDAQGINASAILFGMMPGGHNSIPNASFELVPFPTSTPASFVWDTSTEFGSDTPTGTRIAGTNLNTTTSGNTLALSVITYAGTVV